MLTNISQKRLRLALFLMGSVLPACLPTQTGEQKQGEGSPAPLLPQSSTGSVREESQAPTHVAVLGDSQSTGVYGQRLSDLIRYASTQKLSYFGAASSGRIGGWINGGFSPIPANAYYGCDAFSDSRSCGPTMQAGARTESIQSILANHPYVNLFIITLGDNHFYDPASVKSELPRLIKPILSRGARCAFVTPTEGQGAFANKLDLIANLKAAVTGVEKETGRTCTLIDSYNVGGDVLLNNSDLALMRSSVSADPMKLHPRGAGAKLWAERVYAALVKRGLLTNL